MKKAQAVRYIISSSATFVINNLEASEELPPPWKSNDASATVSLQEKLGHSRGTAALKSLLDPAQALASSQLECKLWSFLRAIVISARHIIPFSSISEGHFDFPGIHFHITKSPLALCTIFELQSRRRTMCTKRLIFNVVICLHWAIIKYLCTLLVRDVRETTHFLRFPNRGFQDWVQLQLSCELTLG